MATRLSLSIFAIAAVAALFHSTAAQTEYIVGDAMGWVVPPGGSLAYSTWAANKTFMVGDTLVFNFTNGSDDVAIITRDEYQDCDDDIDNDDILTIYRTSPAKITLNSTGDIFFASTFNRHCQQGQKLSINVVSRSTTPPAPRNPITFTVGDDLGWIVPPGGAGAYSTWAYNKTFMVGDTLVFNFINGSDNVVRVTRDEYDDCDGDIDSDDILALYTTSPARILLATTGDYFFTSSFQNHCPSGQKLSINVIASTGAAPPTTTPAAPPTTTPAPPTPVATPPTSPSPARSPMTYTVGDNLTWIIPPSTVAYSTWAYNKSFVVGDTLVFEFINNAHDVAIVNKEDFQECDTDSDDIMAIYRTSPVRIVLNSTGEHFFTCTFPNHCNLGQKLAINVTAASTTTTPPPTSATPPSSSSPVPPTTTTPSPTSATPPSSSSPAPPTTTTPSSLGPNSDTATPPTSSASYRVVAGFFVTFSSIVLAFVY